MPETKGTAMGHGSPELEKQLAAHLNVHGHAFQYAVLAEAEDLHNRRRSSWVLEAAEFPVSVNGHSTHIDFVLRDQKEHFYLIAECKRCDPAVSNWAFVKAPYVSRDGGEGKHFVVREVLYKPHNYFGPIKSRMEWIQLSKDIYHLPFELKSGEKGEGHFSKGIKDAVAQVLRANNGFLAFLHEQFENNQKAGKKYFPLFDNKDELVISAACMPVIFTTARLWVSDIDISTADLDSGKLNPSGIQLEEKSWLFFQYPQSPDLQHVFGRWEGGHLDQILRDQYTRTILIVSASGIADCLGNELWHWPNEWHQFNV